MENSIINEAYSYGIFAVLFVALFFYVLRRNDKRECGYQKTIEQNQEVIINLTGRLDVLDDVKKNVEVIKDEIKRR